uniref:Immunoglobulin domain-containing protein n=1 Tax=Scleropages formosus TaxID=113540 RepID=A0A8C9RVI6_SCLFO
MISSKATYGIGHYTPIISHEKDIIVLYKYRFREQHLKSVSRRPSLVLGPAKILSAATVNTFKWLNARKGGSVTIPCFYDQEYKHHVKYWCKGFRWESCSTMVRTNSPQSKGDVSITDDPNKLVFYVTMRNLREKDSDTYWCAVEINMGQDYGVFLPIVIGKGKLTFLHVLFVSIRVANNCQYYFIAVILIDLKYGCRLRWISPGLNPTPFHFVFHARSSSSQQPVVLLILGLLLLVLGVTVAMGTLTMFRKQSKRNIR